MTAPRPAVVPVHPAMFAALAVPNFRLIVSEEVAEPDRHLGGDGRAGPARAAADALGNHPGADHRGPVRADPAAVAVCGAAGRPLRQTARAAGHAGRPRPGLGRPRRGRAGRDIRLWQVVVLAVLFGILSAVDNPARQAFVQEVVGHDLVRNAVTLNSASVNVARVIGPTIAAVLVSTVGIGWCFVAGSGACQFGGAPVPARHGGRLEGSRPRIALGSGLDGLTTGKPHLLPGEPVARRERAVRGRRGPPCGRRSTRQRQ